MALGAESLVGLRAERRLEATYLTQIRSDLEENRTRLEAAIESEESRRREVRTAFDLARSRRQVPADSAQTWLIDRQGLFATDPRLLTGTVAAVIGTGDLRLIRDAGLRAALAAYLTQVVSDRTEFDRWTEQQVPFLASLHRAGVLAGSGEPSQHPAVSALSTNPVDPEVTVALEGVIWTARNRITYLTRMLEATDGLLAALPSGARRPRS